MLKEFKEFIMTGNVVEFAVAVIMAAAIGGVINGFVNDMVMPIVGEATGGTDFSEMYFELSETTAEDGTVTVNAIRYGKWINSIINLILVGFVMFFIVKAYNKTKKKPEPEPEAPAGPSTEDLLGEIRDLLKKG